MEREKEVRPSTDRKSKPSTSWIQASIIPTQQFVFLVEDDRDDGTGVCYVINSWCVRPLETQK